MFPAFFFEQNFNFCDPLLLRATLAGCLAIVLALLFGTRIIRWLQARFREPIVSDSARLNELHQHKKSTPTMGGLFVVAGILLASLLFGDLANGYLQIGILLTVSLTLLGAIDDLHKLRTGKRGLSARAKLAGQLVISLVIALLLHSLLENIPHGLELSIPLTSTSYSLGWLFVPLAMLVLVACSNAVNLTDGLDGLAGGCLVFSTAGMLLLAYIAGQADLAAHWQVKHIPGASEIVVLAGAMLGALLGFLWFNCHPAKVFLGDTGSLPLGGLLGFFALVSRQELLLVVIGGVFVAEAMSVVLQVGIFKWKRVRLFRCAPLHHHFQFLGWGEKQIVTRFWFAGGCCLLLGFLLLEKVLEKVSGTFFAALLKN
jgi:phospho-N-acetylmuramoyl-pentapeptide-transferase